MSEQRSIELRLRANVSEFKSQMDAAASATSNFGKVIEESSRKVEQARDRQRDAAAQVAAAEKRLAQVRSQGGSASKIAQAEKELARAKNLSKTATDNLTEAEARHAKVAQRASTTMGQFAQSITNQADVWDQFGSGLTRTGLALGAIAVLAAVKMSQFESAMSQVAATGEDARGSLDDLRATAIKVGADTKYSATEAAEGITNLLKAGVSASDVINGGLVGTMNLAAAGELGVADAAEIAATALTVFGLKGSDMAHVADLLAAGAGKAQGEVSDLATALKYVGPVAAGMGVSIEETTGALAAFASQGILSDQAGTSLRGVLMSMTSPSAAASKEMKRLGISLYDGQGKFKGLTNVAGQLEKAYSGVSDQAKDTSLGIIFGNAQVTAARVLFKSGAQGIQDWTDKVNDAGYAARSAAIMMDNLGGDVERLGGAVDSSLIQGGTGLNSWARSMVQSATSVVDAFGSVPAPVLESGTRLVAIAAVSALAAGGLVKLGRSALDMRQSWTALKEDSPKVASGIGKVGKAAAVAGAALAAVEIIGVFGSMQQGAIDKTQGSLADVAEAIADVGKASSGLSKLDSVMAKVQGKFFVWQTGASAATDMGDAIKQIDANTSGFLGGMSAFGGFVANLFQTKTALQEMQGQLGKVDQQLAQVGGTQAAVAFDRIAESASRQGVSLDRVRQMFPEYEASLKSTATQMGITNLSAQEYADWMRGKIPSAISAASAAHPELVSKLDDAGQAALGATGSLEDYVKALYESANAVLATSGSQIGFERTIDNSRKAVEKLVKAAKKSGDLKNLTNVGTEEGRQGMEILNGLATATNTYSGQLIKNKASQEEVRLAVSRGREDFIAQATAMGYSKDKAAELADSYGLIPKNVTTDVTDEGTDTAKRRADALSESIKGLPKKAQTKVESEFKKGGIDAAYSALRKIDKKKADAFIQSILKKGGINDWNDYQPKDKNAYIYTYSVQGGGSKKVRDKNRAGGGSVFGAGTETSDSIPAMLSNSEHVLSAREVRGFGGHGQVERLRAMARAGTLPAFRDGGAVHARLPLFRAEGGPAFPQAAAASYAAVQPAPVINVTAVVTNPFTGEQMRAHTVAVVQSEGAADARVGRTLTRQRGR